MAATLPALVDGTSAESKRTVSACSRDPGRMLDEDLSAEMTRLLRHKGPRYGVAVGEDDLARVDDMVRCLRRDV